MVGKSNIRIEPFGSHIVLEILPKDEKSEVGVIIPESAVQTHARAKVVAVGQGYRNADGEFKPCLSKIGDVVLYNKNAGTKIFYKGKEFNLLNDHEVWFREV